MEVIRMDDSQKTQIAPRVTETHCPYCALQCGMNLIERDGSISVAPRQFPGNKGGLCRKGWTCAELLSSRDRLTAPLARDARTQRLREVSWEGAIDRVASGFRCVQQSAGRQAAGVFGGGGLTNEKVYLLGKFARVVVRTANIDYNGRFCMSSAAAAALKALGVDRGLPFPLEDIAHTEVILLVGANVAETMPPLMQYFETQRRHGGRLIVADPRATATARVADAHLQLTPGTDAALANGQLHIAVAEGLVDRDFINRRTVGYEAVRRVVAAYWRERVERITGVPVRLLYDSARLLGRARTAMVLTARGAEQQSRSVDNVLAFINLALALGKEGKALCGYGSLTGQGNGQGGREHVARVWGVEAESLPGPGRPAFEGGAAGSTVRGGDLLATVATHDEVLTLMGRFMQYYRENARYAERSYSFVQRIGIERLRAVLIEDSEGEVGRLDQEVAAAVAAYTDPWAEGRQPYEPAQFEDASHVEFQPGTVQG
jgi:assimilatory nitrate reductase catalytic subunit